MFKARKNCGLSENDTSWCLDEQLFEKMGSLMSENHGKLLGLYEELAMFLSQINVFRGRDLSDSHELALFLQLYGASSWVRRTGIVYGVCMHLYQLESLFLSTAVSGDANFSMHRTGLTLGGFIQPSVTRCLIEQQANVEKGLYQRFFVACPTAKHCHIRPITASRCQFCHWYWKVKKVNCSFNIGVYYFT